MFGHDNLRNYFETNFTLTHFHKYSLSDIENLMSWERNVYVDLISKHTQLENERKRDIIGQQKARERIGK